jgi:hypothetical protein
VSAIIQGIIFPKTILFNYFLWIGEIAKTLLKITLFVLWHVKPLIGNYREISNYATAVAK